MDGGARGSGDADAIGIILKTAFDAIPMGKKGVEALYQIRVPGKEFGNSADDTRCVNASLG